jgi:hypothetical protein
MKIRAGCSFGFFTIHLKSLLGQKYIVLPRCRFKGAGSPPLLLLVIRTKSKCSIVSELDMNV